MFWETVPAVNWSSFSWLKWNLGLNATVRTHYWVQFSGAAAATSETTTVVVSETTTVVVSETTTVVVSATTTVVVSVSPVAFSSP
ncbi:hypothetical protein EO95_07060 [Methanosarcina sp. 1.H.T.1A.1]|nr:hypothetical protein EO95_07060 [Methanosarcina sp. 1.H.T.1A.1]